MFMEEICQALAEYDLEDIVYELELLGIRIRDTYISNGKADHSYRDIGSVLREIIDIYGR